MFVEARTVFNCSSSTAVVISGIEIGKRHSGRVRMGPSISKRATRLAMVLAGGLTLSALVGAQTKHTPTVKETLNLKYVSSPQISPNGRFIAYDMQETNWESNQFIHQIWLLNVATGRGFQLTHGRNSADGASWSPDGKWLAFATEGVPNTINSVQATNAVDKPAGRQIWLISPDGGKAWQLTKSQTGVGMFHWSEDSRYIAFTATALESQASEGRRDEYGDYEVIGKEYQQNQLWSVDVAEAETSVQPQTPERLITDTSINVEGFTWSPDSRRIAFVAAASPLLTSNRTQDIYLLELSQEKTVKKIVGLAGPDFSPMFSPDGKELAFLSWLGQPDYYYANLHIAVVEVARVIDKAATGPSDVRDMTAHFDEVPNLLGWGPTGIYFSAYLRTNVQVFNIEPHGGEIRQITQPNNLLIESASFTQDFRSMAFAAEDVSHMAELYVSPIASFSPKKLTDMTAQVKDWNLGVSEVITWKSQDGTEIDGVLYKPANYDRNRRYPLIVESHGGPADISLPTLSPLENAYPVQQLLAEGSLVLKPNYRGSAGYGAAFRALDTRNVGMGEMSDVMSGVDHLIAQGIVDPNRLGAMGSSWGGYISSFLATHTNRFKAVSESSGITDLTTEYANTDDPTFYLQYLHATPWGDPQVYAKNSPITTVSRATTPVLIQEGSTDKRVPPPNAYELYRALQDAGVESRMILYPGFGHGANQPKPMLAVIQSNLDWFNHYLWNEPIPRDSPLWGSSELGAVK
jgi:dipeptidyl aminopeptidase/acylaminoacyl peptidase